MRWWSGCPASRVAARWTCPCTTCFLEESRQASNDGSLTTSEDAEGGIANSVTGSPAHRQATAVAIPMAAVRVGSDFYKSQELKRQTTTHPSHATRGGPKDPTMQALPRRVWCVHRSANTFKFNLIDFVKSEKEKTKTQTTSPQIRHNSGWLGREPVMVLSNNILPPFINICIIKLFKKLWQLILSKILIQNM